MPQTPTELLDWLTLQQFLTPQQVQELAGPDRFDSSHALVRELVSRGWLSPYQANQILGGKGDDLVLGPHRLLERLGEGSMGQVFKAWNTKLHRVVAVKMIHKVHVENKKAEARFMREMQTAAQLDHPNIVLVRDAGEINGRLYMVMDYIEGTDLSKLVKQNGPLGLEQAVTFACQVARGLQHAYERGVVHRDVKPGNLVVTWPGFDQPPLIKILDFGLARFESERQEQKITQMGAVLGTVDYIAPEQAENASKADIRADLYSLGCTLFYLVTGKPPFAGESLVDKVAARLIGEPPSLRAALPETSAGLDVVLRKIMARRPADRYQTPQEVVQALKPFGLPAPVPPTPVRAAAPPMLRAEVVVPGQAVQPAAASGAVPLAVPVAAAKPVSLANPAGSSGEFSFRTMPTAPALPRPTSATPSTFGRKLPWLLVGGGGVALLAAALVVVMAGGGAGPKPKYPGGELSIVVREERILFDLNDRTPRKLLRVSIRRQHFKGPVTLRIADLPDGVQSEQKIVPEDADKAEVPITVSFGTATQTVEARVVATAEELRAEGALTLDIIGTPVKKKKK